VDLADFKVVIDAGVEITLYVFIMALGFSRHMYVEFIERCTLTAFLDATRIAFGYFGGVPGEIVYENLKNVVRVGTVIPVIRGILSPPLQTGLAPFNASGFPLMQKFF
jgi:transposase